MNRHPKFNTFVMEPLTGLRRDVQTARRHIAKTGKSYSRAAQIIGVSKIMVKLVLTGRERSARVLAGIMALPLPDGQPVFSEGWGRIVSSEQSGKVNGGKKGKVAA